MSDLAELDDIIARLLRFREKIESSQETADLPNLDKSDQAGELRERCHQRGHLLTDDCIDEVALGDIIGVSPYTLRNERQAGAPRIKPRKIGNKHFYAIADIAEYLKSK